MKKIYTKTGDRGKTTIMNPEVKKLIKVSKDDPVIEAIGTIDELNCNIGMLLSMLTDINKTNINKTNLNTSELEQIQNDLFRIGSLLANFIPYSENMISPDYLEQSMNRMCENLEPLKNFILPGGSTVISQCHLSRVITRRAERRIVSIDDINIDIIKYINRLSDYFFILGRMIAKETNIEEIIWKN